MISTLLGGEKRIWPAEMDIKELFRNMISYLPNAVRKPGGNMAV